MLRDRSSPSKDTRERGGDTISIDSGFDNPAQGKSKSSPVPVRAPLVDRFGVRQPQKPVERSLHRSFIRKRRVLDKDGNVLKEEEFEDETDQEGAPVRGGKKRRGRRRRRRKRKTRMNVHRYMNEDGQIVEEEVESDVTDSGASGVTSEDSGHGDLEEEIRAAREKRLKPLAYLPPLPLTDQVKSRNEVEAENNPEDPHPDTKEALELLTKEKIRENEDFTSVSQDEETRQSEKTERKKKKRKQKRTSSSDADDNDGESEGKSADDDDENDSDDSDADVEGTPGKAPKARGKLRRKGRGWWKEVKDRRRLRGRQEHVQAESDNAKKLGQETYRDVPFLEQYRVKKATEAELEKDGLWGDPEKKLAQEIFGLEETDVRLTPVPPQTARTTDTGYETVHRGQGKDRKSLEDIGPPLISIKVDHKDDDQDDIEEKPKDKKDGKGDPETSSGLGDSEGSRQGTPEHTDHPEEDRPRAPPDSRDLVSVKQDVVVDMERQGSSGHSDDISQDSQGVLVKLRLLRERLFGSTGEKGKQQQKQGDPKLSGAPQQGGHVAPVATELNTIGKRRRQVLWGKTPRKGRSLERTTHGNEPGYLSEGHRVESGDDYSDEERENRLEDEGHGSLDGSDDLCDPGEGQSTSEMYPGRKTLPPLHHRTGQSHVILVSEAADGSSGTWEGERPGTPSDQTAAAGTRELGPLRTPRPRGRYAWGAPGSGQDSPPLRSRAMQEGVDRDKRTLEAAFIGKGWARVGPLNLTGAFHAKNFQTPEAQVNARRPGLESRQVTALATSRPPGGQAANKRGVPWARSADPRPPPKTARPSRASQGGSSRTKMQRLLEELYRDKVYFDHLLQNIDSPSSLSESEARLLAQYGRDFLLQVADFRSQADPLPQRPATTSLGGLHLPPVPRTHRNTTTLSLGDLRRHETFC